jgi:hypothetical protein
LLQVITDHGLEGDDQENALTYAVATLQVSLCEKRDVEARAAADRSVREPSERRKAKLGKENRIWWWSEETAKKILPACYVLGQSVYPDFPSKSSSHGTMGQEHVHADVRRTAHNQNGWQELEDAIPKSTMKQALQAELRLAEDVGASESIRVRGTDVHF